MTEEPLVYLDTSVYLGILLGERPALKLLPALAKKRFCSSIFLFIESERNLVRLSREGILSEKDYDKAIRQLKEDQDLFLFKEVTADLCLTGQFPPIRTPRSSDLVHLRTALWFLNNGGLDRFLTLDERQRNAASDLGLPATL